MAWTFGSPLKNFLKGMETLLQEQRQQILRLPQKLP